MPRNGLSRAACQHGGTQAACIEFAHAVGHRALPRKDHALGAGHHRRIGGDDDLLATRDMLERLRHRAQVAHAVVDDGNGIASGFANTHSEPLVNGMAPAMRGSGVVAMRNARPKALKTVSA